MPEKNPSQRVFWLGLALSALSGVLLTLSMPGFDVPLLGWIALAPLLVVLFVAPPSQLFLLTLPFGIIFSIGVHNWYPQIFPPALGYFLILAVGFFYAAILQLGVRLTARLPGALKILALPIAWSAIEFLKRGVVVGETFTVADRTLYTRFGDWFGWLLAGALVLLVIRAWTIKPG